MKRCRNLTHLNNITYESRKLFSSHGTRCCWLWCGRQTSAALTYSSAH